MKVKIPSMWHSIKVIVKKELKDGLRDWKAIPIALLMTAMGPLMVFWIFTLMADASEEPEYVTIPIVGSDNAPELISWLEQNGTTTQEAPKNLRQQVRDLNIEMALVIPEDYRKKIEDGKPVSIELITNSEDRSLEPAVSKMTRLIEAYGAQIGALRMLARGVNPQVATPIVVREVDASEKNRFTAAIMKVVPIFVVMAAFICAMLLASDMTAGERERGSIESLMLNPTSRETIAMGKYLAAAVYCVAGLVLTLAGYLGVLSYLPVEELGISISFDSQTIAGLVATVLPLALMVSGLTILISSLARTYKESQVMMQFVILVPMIPIFIENLGPVRTWMYSIPIFSQQRLIIDVLSGETPALIHYILSGSVSLVIAFVTVWLTTRLFHKESFIFGR